MKHKATTYPMSERSSLVHLKDFARPADDTSLVGFLDGLPHIHAGKVIREAVGAIVNARKNGHPVLLGMGAHVIKCGLTPWLTKLLTGKHITGIALNGAGAIHDVELAAFGRTSEDVGAELPKGRFGFVEETGLWMAQAFQQGMENNQGMGLCLYEAMKSAPERFPHREHSLLWQTGQLSIPCTVHVAIGTDFIHMHPKMDGKSLGATSYQDFELFCDQVIDLAGGVYWNLGSAVLLPEVFLKAVSLAHNLGHDLKGMTTFNMDQLVQYRASTNVVRRPSVGVGKGLHLTGHHEIMVPLISQAILEGWQP